MAPSDTVKSRCMPPRLDPDNPWAEVSRPLDREDGGGKNPNEHPAARPVAREGLRLMTGIFWDLGAQGMITSRACSTSIWPKPCLARWRRSAGRMSCGLVPTTKRSWQ